MQTHRFGPALKGEILIPKISPQDARRAPFPDYCLSPFIQDWPTGPSPTTQSTSHSTAVAQGCAALASCCKEPTVVLHSPGQCFSSSTFTPGERRQGTSHCHFCKAFPFLLSHPTPSQTLFSQPQALATRKILPWAPWECRMGALFPVNLPVPALKASQCLARKHRPHVTPTSRGTCLPTGTVYTQEGPPAAGVSLNTARKQTSF